MAPTQGKVISVSIVDDEETLCRMVKLNLERNGYRVRFHLSGEEALQQIPGYGPDVVLMDLAMPNMCGLECIWRLLEFAPAMKVLLHTAHAEIEIVATALELGARGCLTKPARAANLSQAVHDLASGNTVLSDSMAGILLKWKESNLGKSDVLPVLRGRELEVMKGLVQHRTDKEIGASLNISADTVQNCVRCLLAKLGATDRRQAVARYLNRLFCSGNGGRHQPPLWDYPGQD